MKKIAILENLILLCSMGSGFEMANDEKEREFWRSSNPSRKLLPNWFSEICSAFIYAFRELSLLLDCVIFRRKKSPFCRYP